MSPKAHRWTPLAEAPSPASVTRHATASVLRSASAVLACLARRLAARSTRHRTDPRLEFYAEAGAPKARCTSTASWLAGCTA
ncbi:hypothetical protein FSC37_17505 [Piscinibacter aquaticus]|uniref:Uncharacterized protein n=1 Tax=Piscinibacter aquaticus TaxID=392597 RepID=A0A5C6U1J5_9BURK|nr:hypothetical protein FSC37_17505 [Piscinibacter aquaticus]